MHALARDWLPRSLRSEALSGRFVTRFRTRPRGRSGRVVAEYQQHIEMQHALSQQLTLSELAEGLTQTTRQRALGAHLLR
eukprot:6441477-Alexandrium_andersonii.AAC.1